MSPEECAGGGIIAAMKEPDPLSSALDAIAKPTGGAPNKVRRLYGDRPEVLDSIRKARRDRKLSFRQIADALSASEPDESISEAAIKNWCAKEGIK